MHQRVALGVRASEGLLPLQLRPSRSVGEGGRTGRASASPPLCRVHCGVACHACTHLCRQQLVTQHTHVYTVFS